MGKADLHIHTVYSWDGTCAVEAVLKQAAHVAHLDVIAITDHDEICGALEAEELAFRYGIEVIPGSEISTADGHLLALFIREKIPAGLSLVETVLRVHEKGGLCVVPHPEAKGTPSINRTVLQAALGIGWPRVGGQSSTTSPDAIYEMALRLALQVIVESVA